MHKGLIEKDLTPNSIGKSTKAAKETKNMRGLQTKYYVDIENFLPESLKTETAHQLIQSLTEQAKRNNRRLRSLKSVV